MTGLFASLFVRKALDKLASYLPATPTASQDLEDLRRLERTMRRIHATLHDAEEHWNVREESAKLRLQELKDLAYDAEDVVEEYEYECKVEALERSTRINHKRKREKVTPLYNLFRQFLFMSVFVVIHSKQRPCKESTETVMQ